MEQAGTGPETLPEESKLTIDGWRGKDIPANLSGIYAIHRNRDCVFFAKFFDALFNLLLNAVQAVEPGGQIEVRSATVAGTNEAILEICDDGHGVPEADRANIFNPYVTMRPKGVGLGLAIVKQIISAHRWEIACLANQPRGAVFRLSHLKIAPAHA